jgi:hypothetical protein
MKYEGQTSAPTPVLGAKGGPARPLNRSNIVDGVDRLSNTLKRLRDARQRTAMVAGKIVGDYATLTEANGIEEMPESISGQLHRGLDVFDEEVSYLLDAVCALEGSTS